MFRSDVFLSLLALIVIVWGAVYLIAAGRRYLMDPVCFFCGNSEPKPRMPYNDDVCHQECLDDFVSQELYEEK